MAGCKEDSIFDATRGPDASSPKRIDHDGAELAPSRDDTPAVAEKPAGFEGPAVVVNDAATTRPAHTEQAEQAFADACNRLDASRPTAKGDAGADSAPNISETRGERATRPIEYGKTVEELWAEIELRQAALLGAHGGTTETSERPMSCETGAGLAPNTDDATQISKEGGDEEQISAARDVNDASSPTLTRAAAYAALLAETYPSQDPSKYPLLLNEDSGKVVGYYDANEERFFTADGSEADSRGQRAHCNEWHQLPLPRPSPTSKPLDDDSTAEVTEDAMDTTADQILEAYHKTPQATFLPQMDLRSKLGNEGENFPPRKKGLSTLGSSKPTMGRAQPNPNEASSVRCPPRPARRTVPAARKTTTNGGSTDQGTTRGTPVVDSLMQATPPTKEGEPRRHNTVDMGDPEKKPAVNTAPHAEPQFRAKPGWNADKKTGHDAPPASDETPPPKQPSQGVEEIGWLWAKKGRAAQTSQQPRLGKGGAPVRPLQTIKEMVQRQAKKQTDAQSDWVVFGGAKTTPTIWNAVGCRARVRQGNADFQYKKSWEGNLNFHASNDDNASDALGAFSKAFDLKLGSSLEALLVQLAPDDGKMKDIIDLGNNGKRKVEVESAGIRVQVSSYQTNEGFTYIIFSVSYPPAIVDAASEAEENRCQPDEKSEGSVSPNRDGLIARMRKVCAAVASTKPSGAGRRRDSLNAYMNWLGAAALAFAESQTGKGVEDVSKAVEEQKRRTADEPNSPPRHRLSACAR